MFHCFKGSSIYDVHTEEGGSQAQVDAGGRGEGSSPWRRLGAEFGGTEKIRGPNFRLTFFRKKFAF